MVAELRAVYGSFHRTFFQPPPDMLLLSKTGYQQPWVYSDTSHRKPGDIADRAIFF